MQDSDSTDNLLDQWEALLERDPKASVDAFVEQHANNLGNAEVAQLRKNAEALARMRKRLASLEDTDDLTDTPVGFSEKSGRFAHLQPGYETLDGYKLVERLGEGGFGEVWKATDAQGFSVAIKFVSMEGAFGDKELASLDVIKDVRHPHLLTVFRTCQVEGVLVIAMELADRSLMDRLDEARKEGHDGIPRDELLEYMAEAAKGIDYLNDPGASARPRIQHRDIKPQNLLLSGNSVKIADYSLAQALTFNVADSTGSTPAYAAPEFFDGNTTSQSDQYSLAITYCMLRGGRLPFEGNLAELIEAHRKQAPDLSMIPAGERPAITRALAKKSKDRWPTCSEFVLALREAGSTSPVKSSFSDIPTRTALTVAAIISFAILVPVLWSFGLFGGGRAAQDDTAHSGTADAVERREPPLTSDQPGKTTPLNGAALSSNAESQRLAIKERKVELAEILKDFPLSVMRYESTGDVNTTQPGSITSTLRCTLDRDKFRQLLTKLSTFAEANSVYQASTKLRIEPGARIGCGGCLDEKGTAYLKQVMEADREQKSLENDASSLCFLIIGRSISPSRERGDHGVLTADYFVMKKAIGDVILAQWKRAARLTVRCELVDGEGGTISTLIETPARVSGRYPQKVGRLPLSPVGFTWSGTTLDLDYDYNRNPYLYPSVLMFLPTILAPTGPVSSDPKMALMDTYSDLPLLFNVPPDDIPKIKALKVVPKLPGRSTE